MSIGSAQTITVSISFIAGVASLLSPCVLALLPVYATYLSGLSAAAGDGETNLRSRLFWNALFLIIGFTLVFIAFFGLTTLFLGRILLRNQVLLRQLSGILVIVFGLHATGLIRLPFLLHEARPTLRNPRATPLGSLLLGMAFAAGWTPCVGPVLSAILVLSANAETAWAGLVQLLAYSTGMAIPFLLFALFLTRLRGVLRWIQRHGDWVSRLTGVLLVGIGVMLYTNSFTRLASWFSYWQLLP